MADLTPEVLNALVRLMKGEIDWTSLDEAQIIAVVTAYKPEIGRRIMSEGILELNDRGRTFAWIAEHMDVHEATAARWAKPPAEDRRRRKGTND